MKKFASLLTEEKRLKMNGKMMTDFVRALYSVKKIGLFFFHTYWSNCLNKHTPVLLRVKNI